MATTTTNFGWDIPQSTDLVKDGATAIAALGQDIDTALVDLKGGTTGQVLAKATNTDLDFTWVAQDDSNAIQNAIVDAKGDLISATANDTPARLAVGTNGQVLTADSTTATGLAWTTAGTGGMTLLSTTTLTGSSVTISSISQSYKHLLVVIKNVVLSGNDDVRMRLNSDTTSRYRTSIIRVINASIDGFNAVLTGHTLGASASSTNWDNKYSSESWLWRYTDTSLQQIRTVYSGYNGTQINAGVNHGTYDSSAAITSMTIGTVSGATFSSGTVYIYGVN